MEYKNKNYSSKLLPVFEPGDIINGGIWDQLVLVDVSADITIKNNPSLFNWNLTGNYQAEGNFQNTKKDLCYHLHLDKGLESLPTYHGPGATCGPDVGNCRHVNPDKVYNIKLENETIQVFDDAREDTPLNV